MTTPVRTRAVVAGLLVIGVVAVALRLPGLDAYLPDTYWHDELNFVEGGLRVGAGEVVGASYGGYTHGTLTYYVLFAAFAAFFVVGRILGIFQGPNDLLMSYVTDPSAIFLVARLVMLATMTAVVALTFVLARRLFGLRAAWVSATLVAFSFQSVQITLGKEDGLFTLLVLATVWFAFRLIEAPPARWRLVVLGAMAGAATAVKYFGVCLLPLLAVTVLLAEKGRPRITDLVKKTGLAAAVFVLALLTLVPGIVFDTARFVASAGTLTTINTATTFTVMGVAVSPWYGYLWSALAISNGPLAAALFYVAAIWLLVRDRRQGALLLVHPAALIGGLTLTLVVGRPAEAVNFYLVSALPLLCIAAGALLAHLMSLDSAARVAAAAALVAILATNLVDDLRFQRLLGLTDTRTITRQWIERNLPEGSSILAEGAIGTILHEGPQLQETAASLNRTLEEIRRLGGGGGLWAAKLRAAEQGGGPRRFDVVKVRELEADHLRAMPSYVVVRSDRARQLVDATGRYRVVFTAASDSPGLFRSLPLMASADIGRLRRIPLQGEPGFTPGPTIHVYHALEQPPQ